MCCLQYAKVKQIRIKYRTWILSENFVCTGRFCRSLGGITKNRMNTKQIEYECFSAVQKTNCYGNKELQSIHKRLKMCNQKEVDFDTERPDIIIKDGKGVVGIEHFQVDTLEMVDPQKRRFGSEVRREMTQYESFMNKITPEDDAFGFEAGKLVGDIIKQRWSAKSAFRFCNFLENWERVYTKHAKNKEAYIKNLQAGCHRENISLYALVDIPLFDCMVANLIITCEFLSVIEAFPSFDCVIIYMHDYSGYKNSICYYIRPQRTVLDAIEQKICPFPQKIICDICKKQHNNICTKLNKAEGK